MIYILPFLLCATPEYVANLECGLICITLNILWCRSNYNTILCIFSDVDECAVGTANCAHNCQDTIGSYLCSCDPGFMLDTDGFTCNGIIRLHVARARARQFCGEVLCITSGRNMYICT